MPTINVNTSIAVPAGAVVLFAPGGAGRAIDGDGNIYTIGLAEMQIGPFTKASTVQIQVINSPVTYAIESVSALSSLVEQDPFTSQLKTQGGVAVSGLIPRPTLALGGFGTPAAFTNYTQGTFAFGRQVPFEFTGVQVGIYHVGGSGACQGIKMLVGSTDDMGTADYATATAATLGRFCVPRRGGTVTNTLTADGGFTGWQRVTFNGANTVDLADAGANNYSATLSDIMPVSSAPDAANPGWYNLIGRIHFTDATTWTACNVNGLTTGTQMRDFFGGPRILFARTSGDDVTDPTTWGEGTTPSVPTGAHLPLFFVFHGVGGKRFVTFVGDSRFATSSETTSERYRNVHNYMTLIDPDLRVGILGGSGWTGTQYTNLALANLRAGTLRGGTLIHLIYSVNDGSPTPAVLAASKARASAIAAECERQGVQLMLVDAFPTGGTWTPTQLADLYALRSWALTLTPTVASPIRKFGDVAGVWVPGVGFDTSHMTNNGYRLLAQYLYNVLNGTEA